MSADLRAVLDIGSNTIRFLIAEVSENKPFKKVHYQHKIVRLGEGLQQTGRLGDAGITRALAAFEEIIQAANSLNIQAADIRAVATAAVREASNGRDFVCEVLKQTGLKINIISGEEEALLALAGARLGLPDELGQNMCLFDIGGGSTEFTRVSHGVLKGSVSKKLGVVRLIEGSSFSNPPTAEDYNLLKSSAATFIDENEEDWKKYPELPKHLVGTAGTVTTLAAIAQDMITYDASKIDGFRMSKAEFYTLRDRLVQMTNEQRLEIPALEKGREDVIVAGLAIIDVLFERWNYDALVSVDSGLLEGLLIVK